MNKRGISPIISMVMLICAVVLLALVILTWTGVFSKGLLKSAETTSEKAMACGSEVNVNIRHACIKEDKIVFMVESMGSKPVKKIIFRVLGSSGGYQEEKETDMKIADLLKYEIEKKDVGNIKNVEILPIIELQGKEENCGVEDTEASIAASC